MIMSLSFKRNHTNHARAWTRNQYNISQRPSKDREPERKKKKSIFLEIKQHCTEENEQILEIYKAHPSSPRTPSSKSKAVLKKCKSP